MKTMLKFIGVTLTDKPEVEGKKRIMFERPLISKGKGTLFIADVFNLVKRQKQKIWTIKQRYIRLILSEDNTEKDKKLFYCIDLGIRDKKWANNMKKWGCKI